MSAVEALVCRACKQTFGEHVSGKCLFEASTFTADEEEMSVALSTDINHSAASREELEKKWSDVCDITQLQEGYKVHAFLAPLIRVTRLSDGCLGYMIFQHAPRYYFGFKPLEF